MRSKNIPGFNNSTQTLLRCCINPKKFIDFFDKQLVLFTSRNKNYIDNGALRLFWYNECPNLGDEISAAIVQKISGMETCHARSYEKKKVLAIGSVIDNARSGDLVWGSGAIEQNIQFAERDFIVTAVRGPKTRDVLLSQGIDCPEVYGDPAILTADIYPAPAPTSRPYRLGIVPHYADKHLFNDWKDPSVLILDIQSGREKFLHALWQCQRVVSSSLHGIIFAESYGIPAHWMVLSNKLRGGEFKFHDYYLGTDRDPPQPYGFENIKAESNWISPSFGKEALLHAFPRDAITQTSAE